MKEGDYLIGKSGSRKLQGIMNGTCIIRPVFFYTKKNSTITASPPYLQAGGRSPQAHL
jgi:hypothetical protein